MNPQKENISPEEKLLRLIRGQKRHDAVIEKKSAATVIDLKPTIKSSGFALKQRYLVFLNVHKIILIAFVLSCAYLIISFIYPWFGLRKIKLPKITPEKTNEEKIGPTQEIEPLEFYLQGLKDRRIFSGGATGEETQSPAASAINTDLVKDINLVGIISGENAQAIIEDKKTQKSYYLSKGQFIGVFQIEDIQEGKVILNYNGQRFELYL